MWVIALVMLPNDSAATCWGGADAVEDCEACTSPSSSSLLDTRLRLRRAPRLSFFPFLSFFFNFLLFFLPFFLFWRLLRLPRSGEEDGEAELELWDVEWLDARDLELERLELLVQLLLRPRLRDGDRDLDLSRRRFFHRPLEVDRPLLWVRLLLLRTALAMRSAWRLFWRFCWRRRSRSTSSATRPPS